MGALTTNPIVAELLDAFTQATPGRRDTAYQRLVAALWRDGELTPLAEGAVPSIVARLDSVGGNRQGYLLVLLGLLAEADPAGESGAVHAAVHAGLERYLSLLDDSSDGNPLMLALLYLLAHFPQDRRRILAAVPVGKLDLGDLSRLDRALRRLDPDNPELGRVWPAPSVWALSDAEQEFDQVWIRDLTPAQVCANWENDTRTVLGYSGAKAYWAVCNGRPAPVADALPHDEPVEPVPPDPSVDLFASHAAAFRCPACLGRLVFQAGGVRCAGCSTWYPIAGGLLDLSAGHADVTAGGSPGDGATADLLQKLAAIPSIGNYYEAVLRPAFLRVAGGNWGGAVSPSDEDSYIAAHLRPVAGPVLDLAAGAGRWTAVVSDIVGAERVIALDMALPMLSMLRRRLPRVPSVLADALALPFDDASLGAVNCWNALQAFPEQAATALAEIGRCLRPGGVLTMMTYRWSPDPVYRHFQASHHFPSRPEGMLLFELEEIRQWLDRAGLAIRDESGPATFVFITAQRRDGRQPAVGRTEPAQ